MSAIDVLNSEIRELQSENDPHKKHLTKLLLKQSNEQLNEVQKRELDDEIKSADKRISEINQIIIEKEKQITKINAQIEEQEKRMTLDKQITMEQIKLERIKNQGKSTALSFVDTIFHLLLLACLILHNWLRFSRSTKASP